MPIFQWKARTRQGSLKKGEIEAMNEAAVMAQLRSQMLLPVAVKEKSKDISEYLPFLKPGTYQLFCYLHPMTMHEQVDVVP